MTMTETGTSNGRAMADDEAVRERDEVVDILDSHLSDYSVEQLATFLGNVQKELRKRESAARAALIRIGELVGTTAHAKAVETAAGIVRTANATARATESKSVQKRKAAQSAPDTDGDRLARVLRHIAAAGAKGLRSEEVQTAARLGKDECARVLQRAVATKQVRKTGKARGVRYFAK
jgi:hypothetical protein